MKKQTIEQAYAMAKERYADLGVDTDAALAKLQKISLSLHCWQADDVTGFENPDAQLSGGIQTTGNYPGKARNIEELRQDILTATSLIPGRHRLSLHASYADFRSTGAVDRDALRPEHFASWMDWAEANGMKLDFNSTSFSHPKSGMLTLSNPDEGIRRFWVEHTKRCREIAEEMGRRQGDPAMLNIWIHDGSKDTTVNRIGYRRLLKQSLDEIFAVDYANMKDCIEAKLFGIGAESYTVGSYDFYLGYGAKYGKIVTLDTGHFHLTESIADKVSSLLLFTPEIMLHVSRPIRWDSDHVVIAYVVGARATQKCVLQALLEPLAKLREYEASDRLFERLALLEEAKNLPWNAVWDMFCLQNDVPAGEAYIADVEKYEKDVTSKRA